MIPALILVLFLADARTCGCDPAKPETMEATSCSLCREAERQPLDQGVFFVKDTNPTKPNRLLALPRKHTAGPHYLYDLTASDRIELLTAAIAKSKELWGDNWGVAYNGVERRTQCHAHLHIGKVTATAETGKDFSVLDGPADIVIPKDGSGFWIHSVNGKIHEHAGEQVTEFNLER